MDSIYRDELSCTVCFEQYDEKERCPRLLTCGHSFCTLCIRKLISNTCSCPTCSRAILTKEITSIPIVYALKNMIQIPSSPELRDESEEISERKVQCFGNLKLCEDDLDERIKELEKLCRTNEAQEKLLAAQISYYKKQQEVNEQQLRELSVKNDNILKCKLKVTEFEDAICRQKDIILNMASINELNNFEKKLTDMNLSIRELEFQFLEGVFSISYRHEVPTIFDNPTKEDILRAVNEFEKVYAFRCEDSINQYGKISIDGSFVLMHCLHEKFSSSNSEFFAFNDCLLAFNGNACLPHKSFMEISVNDEICGTVIFEANSEPEGDAFIRLCCGIDRVSFKGKEWDRGNPGYWIRTANIPISPMLAASVSGRERDAATSVPFISSYDVENSDTSRPNVLQLESMARNVRTIVNPTGERLGVREGSLVGSFLFASDQAKKSPEESRTFDKFGARVWLRDWEDSSSQKQIGLVVSGLNILKKVDNMVKEGRVAGFKVKIVVSDCGIIL